MMPMYLDRQELGIGFEKILRRVMDNVSPSPKSPHETQQFLEEPSR